MSTQPNDATTSPSPNPIEDVAVTSPSSPSTPQDAGVGTTPEVALDTPQPPATKKLTLSLAPKKTDKYPAKTLQSLLEKTGVVALPAEVAEAFLELGLTKGGREKMISIGRTLAMSDRIQISEMLNEFKKQIQEQTDPVSKVHAAQIFTALADVAVQAAKVGEMAAATDQPKGKGTAVQVNIGNVPGMKSAQAGPADDGPIDV